MKPHLSPLTDMLKRSLRGSLQLVLTIACFTALWRYLDGPAALQQLADTHPGWIAATFVILTLQTLMSARRWQLTAVRLGISLNIRTAIREYFLGQIVNQVLPGGVLGDAGRAYRARHDAGLAAAGQAVLFERMVGQLALLGVFILAVIASSLLPGEYSRPIWLQTAIASLIAVGGGTALIYWACRRGWCGSPLQAFAGAFNHAVMAREVRAEQCVLSLGTAMCNVAGFACCLWAMGSSVSFVSVLSLIPLILLSMTIPLTVSGWGLREGAAVALLPLAGATASEALAASVAFGITFFLTTLPGFIILGLTTRDGENRSAAVRQSAAHPMNHEGRC